MQSDYPPPSAYADAILSRRLNTDWLSTISLRWTLPPLELLDDWIANHIAHDVVNIRFMQQEALVNTEFFVQVVRSTIAYITNDLAFREYYFDLVLQQLGMFNQWYGLPDLPWVPIEATTPYSQTPTEAASPPSTRSSVSRNTRVQKFMCNHCQRSFSRRDALERHIKNTCTYQNGPTSYHTFNGRVTH